MRTQVATDPLEDGCRKDQVEYSWIYLLCSIATGISFGVFVWLAFQPDPIQPEVSVLRFSTTHQDLGRVDEGQHRLEYQLHNTGDEPVHLSSVKRSCRCSEVEIRQRTIAPGEAIPVVCMWNTSGLRGPSGSEFTVLYSIADDPGIHFLSASLSGEVAPNVLFDPAELTFHRSEGAMDQAVQFFPKPGLGELGEIESAVCTGSAFEVRQTSSDAVNLAFTPERLRGARRNFALNVDFQLYEGTISVPVTVLP